MNSELYLISSSYNNRCEAHADSPKAPSSGITRGVHPRLSFGRGLRNSLRLHRVASISTKATSWGTDSSAELNFDDDVSEVGLRKSILKQASLSDVGADSFNDSLRSKSGRKQVRFNMTRLKGTKIHKVPTFFQYASDLWWTREEIELQKVDQSDFSKASNEEKAIAKMYLRAYRKGRQEIREKYCSTRSNTSSNLSRLRKSDDASIASPNLSEDIYTSLVNGRSLGFAGLELYAKASYDKRGTVKEIISAIVKVYQANLVIHGSPSSSMSKNSKNNSIDDYTSLYSQSLTASDRSWGLICGRADHEGVDRHTVGTVC